MNIVMDASHDQMDLRLVEYCGARDDSPARIWAV